MTAGARWPLREYTRSSGAPLVSFSISFKRGDGPQRLAVHAHQNVAVLQPDALRRPCPSGHAATSISDSCCPPGIADALLFFERRRQREVQMLAVAHHPDVQRLIAGSWRLFDRDLSSQVGSVVSSIWTT